jgi:predicted phage terminase large subunit-like protein
MQLPKIDINALRAELCKRNFYEFVQYFWDTIIAEEPIWNWHIKYLCDELQEIGLRVARREKKEYDYYIINVPPGSSKSTIISEMYPLWCWANDATQRFICGTYASTPAEDIAEKCFNIYNSEKFRILYPQLVEKRSGGKTGFKNGLRGERYTTSTGSGITGIHAHQIILDDPMSRDIAASDKERKTANKWVSETISTRKVDSNLTVTIVVMQRLHEQDTTGYLLAKKGLNIKHICIPAELSNDVKPNELKRFYVNGLFDPIRRGFESLITAKEDLGSYGYAGQMSQRPSPADGGYIRKEWFQVIGEESLPHDCNINFQLDTAYTDKQVNDPSSAIAYFKVNGIIFVTNVISVYKDFPNLTKWLPLHVNEYGYNEFSRIYVEPKATGKTLVQQIKANTSLNIIESESPKVDKVTRVRSCSAKMESGKVVLLKGHWNEGFINQLASFPNAAHDDEVDCLTAIIERELIQNSNYGQYSFG